MISVTRGTALRADGSGWEARAETGTQHLPEHGLSFGLWAFSLRAADLLQCLGRDLAGLLQK